MGNRWLGAIAALLIGGAACSIPDETFHAVDAAPDDAPDPVTERCTSSKQRGALAVDEDLDGKVDEGCTWSFGAPHWLSPLLPGVPAKKNQLLGYLDPNWISPDGLRLYVVYEVASTWRVVVLRRTSRDRPFEPARTVASQQLTSPALVDHAIIGITFSQDEREAIFSSRPVSAPKGPITMYRMTRKSVADLFLNVESLPALSTITDVERPSLSSDGKELFYAANRQLYRAVRATPDDAFGKPEALKGLEGIDVNGAYLARDGETLFYYGKFEPGRPFRIHRSKRLEPGGAAFGPREDVIDLDATGTESSFHPVLSESTHELYFGSYRAWGPHNGSLWRAQICRDGVCANPTIETCTGILSPDGLHCYTRTVEAKSRADAEADCQKAQGHLASIHSPAEHELVWSNFGSEKSMWLGGFDDRNGVKECNTGMTSELPFPCAWGWESGELWTYQLWGADATKAEPEEAGEQDCLLVTPSYGVGWADQTCVLPNRGLCETSRFPTW